MDQHDVDVKNGAGTQQTPGVAPPTSAPVTTPPSPHGVAQSRSLFDRQILGQAFIDSFKKLDPRVQVENPVMFVVLVGTVVTFIESIPHPSLFDWSITAWLFLTVIFANFAEAMAEGRGKAQAETLRRMRSEPKPAGLGPIVQKSECPRQRSAKGTWLSARPAISSLRTGR